MSAHPMFVGPAYIAHPLTPRVWDADGEPAELSPEQRARGIERNRIGARLLAYAVRSAGVATVSPLQESIACEDTLPETKWLIHGMIVLSACECIVVPDYWHSSHGCRLEIQHANELGLLTFVFSAEERNGVVHAFTPGRDFLEWRDEQRRLAV